jgi:hypothetical protein
LENEGIKFLKATIKAVTIVALFRAYSKYMIIRTAYNARTC